MIYPLDLIITRLQIQRQLREDQSHPSEGEYQDFKDAARKIYANEGGLSGFFTGVWQDTGKTIADSFLFFLAYTYLRRRRMSARGDGKTLPAVDELGVGFLAGAFSKLLTTPIANIVTRKQTAALKLSNSSSTSKSSAARTPSSSQIAHGIFREKGAIGFWSGYSASLVLTLNPSLTFFLFETLKRLLLPRSKRNNPPPAATFFLSAISKACASSVTYPFSLAKTRAQAGSRKEEKDEEAIVHHELKRSSEQKAVRSTIFSTLLTIAQTEGVQALYEGLELEIVKGFFNHGITMLIKQAIHRLVIQTYYILSLVVSRYKGKVSPMSLAERAKQRSVEYYDLAIVRAGERVEEAKAKVLAKAYETAEFVGEYIEEDSEDWKDLYGTTGLARWLTDK